MTRPDWWPTWLPQRCSSGHELKPGTVNQSWVACRCPGSDGGHHLQICRVDGCDWRMWPPEHHGEELPPR